MTTPKSQRTYEQPDQELAQDILDYLTEHPAAADTLEGIAEWWLLRQRVRIIVAQVDRVLRRLADQGDLEVTGSGPSQRYRLKGSSGR